MGISKFRLVVVWYVLPLIYLALFESMYLPNCLLIIIFFLLGLSVGYFSCNSVSIKSTFSYKKLLDSFVLFIIGATAIIQAYGFLRVFLDGADISTYRDEFYENSGGVFKSTYLYTLYTIFLMPLLIFGSMYYLNSDFKAKHTKKIVVITFIIIILDGILKFGRFQYLFVLFFLYLSYRKFGLSKLSLLIGFLLMIVISFVTIYFRQFYLDAAVTTGLEIVNKKIIQETITKYQFVGYLFLEKLTAGRSLLGHPMEFNTVAFSELFLKTITTKAGFNLTYAWESYNKILSEGTYEPKLDIYYNAFSTNFLPIFLDYGVIGIFVYGTFSGCLISIKTTNPFIATFQYLNLFVLIFGIYQPIITTLLGFLLIIFFLISFLKFIKVLKIILFKQQLT
jgi:oligosaccharide repeat unit polymerase